MKSYEEIREHLEMLQGSKDIIKLPSYGNMAHRLKSDFVFDSHFFRGFYPTLRDIVTKRMDKELIKRLYFETNDLILSEDYDNRLTTQRRLIGERNAYAFALDWEVNPLMKE